ncbi:MAG: response regulator transcription factor [Bacillota bacterium]
MSDVRFLIADDEKEIQLLLKKYLEREGFAVDCANDGEEALHFFKEKDYQFIILDIMMPKVDGIEVCRILRNQTAAPIFMLTAKDDEIDKILGLSIGADDYITKPFSIKELIARIKAHLRKMVLLKDAANHTEESTIRFHDLQIDFQKYIVLKKGHPLSLTAKEFELLKLFVSHPGQVFTKPQIFHQVWGDDYFSDDNTVMVHIRRLRKKIEADPDNPTYIQTVWGIGYKFSGDEQV